MYHTRTQVMPDFLVHKTPVICHINSAVVMVCDGVTNTMSDQDIADTAWQVMGMNGFGPVQAAQEIANRAQAAGSTDNVTVLIMRLGWAQPPSARRT